jgi:hypothetical protein
MQALATKVSKGKEIKPFVWEVSFSCGAPKIGLDWS